MKHFFIALAFLTRLPVPDLGRVEAADIARSALFYPAVGLLLGGIFCLPVWWFAGTEVLVMAALLVVLWAMLTGGLHLDGLADSADAWLGGQGDAAKTHRILKDSLVGSAGVVAVVAVMLLRFAVLVSVLQQGEWLVLLLAPVLGRCVALLLFMSTPYVRQNGLGSAISEHLPFVPAVVVSFMVVVIATVVSWQGTLLLLVGTFLLRRLMIDRLRGCTGDTIGAAIELGEVFWLLGAALAVTSVA